MCDNGLSLVIPLKAGDGDGRNVIYKLLDGGQSIRVEGVLGLFESDAHRIFFYKITFEIFFGQPHIVMPTKP